MARLARRVYFVYRNTLRSGNVGIVVCWRLSRFI